jgi:PAS domain S-box-containing protein
MSISWSCTSNSGQVSAATPDRKAAKDLAALTAELIGPSAEAHRERAYNVVEVFLDEVVLLPEEITERKNVEQALLETEEFKSLLLAVSPVCDPEGNVARLTAIAREVTIEAPWLSIFQDSAIGVALTDLNGRFMAANPAYRQMVGYSEEELRALTFLDITFDVYYDANLPLFSELVAEERRQFQIEKQYRRKDGNLIWVRNSASIVPDTTGRPRFLMTLSEDITQRKRAEEALRNSEERVRLILDSAAEGIFGCDSEGTCLFCNPAAMRMLGYDDVSELLGKNMHRLEHHTRPDGRPYPIEECPIYIGF